MGCRDCPRCLEPIIVYLFKLPFRVAWEILTFWNLGLFRRYCPQCGHKIRIHTKVGQRFQD